MDHFLMKTPVRFISAMPDLSTIPPQRRRGCGGIIVGCSRR
ncbi:hypothetical protein D083_0631 [Dickeya solani RNS 08.23.3.1.A]|nr:hypothetical protein D083_0631 [Dickeya solani RNS 08.23.3.1.A]